jgi:benzil reductase ((S)-benzoin forming)
MFLITGGGSGLGQALALALASRGESVLIIGRRKSLLEETAAKSPLINYLEADISTEQGIDLLRQQINPKSSIKALINNAGTLEPIVTLKEMRINDWHKTLNTNLDAAFLLPQKLYSQLINGRVLNIGSGAAYFAIKGWAAYCVSKAALAMLTRCWQLESREVSFASVMPGIVDTQMQVLAREGMNMDPDQSHFYQQLKQTGRLLQASTVAEFLVWLLLDVDKETFISKEWDVYDINHHGSWLKAPHHVPHWES